jgi:hypothetical protein
LSCRSQATNLHVVTSNPTRRIQEGNLNDG